MTLLPMDGGLGGSPRMFGGRRWPAPDTGVPAFNHMLTAGSPEKGPDDPEPAPAIPLQGPFAVQTDSTPPTPPRPGMFGRGHGGAKPPVDASSLPSAGVQGPGANSTIDPRLTALVGQAPTRNRGGFGDILAAILSVAADATDPNGRGQAAARLGKSWQERSVAYDKALTGYEDRKRMATMPGMTEREMAAYLADPKAWGSNMSNAFASRHSAATLNPGDTRVYGDPSIGGNTYQAPTRGEQYAESLGLTPGTNAWNNAVRDQELGANGPTGFANSQSLQNDHQAQAEAMERLRQRGRLTLNGVQQAGRERIRGQPTYRDTHPQPPRPRTAASGAGAGEATARDARGNVIYYRGGRWVDASGKPVD